MRPVDLELQGKTYFDFFLFAPRDGVGFLSILSSKLTGFFFSFSFLDSLYQVLRGDSELAIVATLVEVKSSK